MQAQVGSLRDEPVYIGHTDEDLNQCGFPKHVLWDNPPGVGTFSGPVASIARLMLSCISGGPEGKEALTILPPCSLGKICMIHWNSGPLTITMLSCCSALRWRSLVVRWSYQAQRDQLHGLVILRFSRIWKDMENWKDAHISWFCKVLLIEHFVRIEGRFSVLLLNHCDGESHFAGLRMALEVIWPQRNSFLWMPAVGVVAHHCCSPAPRQRLQNWGHGGR